MPAASMTDWAVGTSRVSISEAAHAATVVTRWPPGLTPDEQSKSRTNSGRQTTDGPARAASEARPQPITQVRQRDGVSRRSLCRGGGRCERAEQAAEAGDRLGVAETAQGHPDTCLIRGDDGLAGPPLHLLDGLDRPPGRARAQQRVRLGPAGARGEVDHDGRILIVDALISRSGRL